MSLSVKHYNGSWIDISDYVVGAGDVPYISRNRDWTLRAETWSVSIASTIRDHASYADNFVFSADEKFAVWDSTKLLFAGYIKKAPLDYESMTFNIEVVNDLQKMEDYRIDYDTLHATLIAGSPTAFEYRVRSYYLMPSVHYLYLMKKMFSIAGLTLDTSELDDVTAFTYTYTATAFLGEYTAAVKYKDLFVGESELYCLNQSFDSYHTTIDSTIYDHSKDKITFFELIKELCSYLSLMIVPTAIDNYKLILSTSNYTIADDDKYEYTSELIAGNEDINNLGGSAQYVSSYKVLSVAENTSLQAGSIGKGGGLSWLSKLKIVFIYEVIPYNDTKSIPITNAIWTSDAVRYTTVSAHGLLIGDYVLIFGVAGMTQPNGSCYPTAAADYNEGGAGTQVVFAPTTYAFSINFTPQPNNYLEGGWVRKDVTEYNTSFKIARLEPESITANATVTNGRLNVWRNQVRASSSNYTEEKITCPLQETDKTVVENFIDLENRVSKIIQETY